MSTHHVLDELSAYIDGACADPDRIARHLQSCSSCARHHLELRRVSAHLRALPAPPVSEDFAERVAARLDEAPPVTPLFSPLVLRFACAACAAIALGGLALRFGGDGKESGGAKPVPVNLAWQDDERVVEEFARLMDAGVALDVFGDPSEVESDEPWPQLDEDAMLEVLAEDVAEFDSAEELPEDLGAILDALAEIDAQMLSELLRTNDNEG